MEKFRCDGLIRVIITISDRYHNIVVSRRPAPGRICYLSGFEVDPRTGPCWEGASEAGGFGYERSPFGSLPGGIRLKTGNGSTGGRPLLDRNSFRLMLRKIKGQSIRRPPAFSAMLNAHRFVSRLKFVSTSSLCYDLPDLEPP